MIGPSQYIFLIFHDPADCSTQAPTFLLLTRQPDRVRPLNLNNDVRGSEVNLQNAGRSGISRDSRLNNYWTTTIVPLPQRMWYAERQPTYYMYLPGFFPWRTDSNLLLIVMIIDYDYTI